MLTTASENVRLELEAVNACLRFERSSAGTHEKEERMERAERVKALVMQREALSNRYKLTSLRLQRIGNALDILSQDERDLLSERYINNTEPELTMDRLGFEKTSFYRRHNEALEKFTRALYGVVIS